MKTRRCLVLFPTMFILVLLLVSCSSVGFAKDGQPKSVTYIESQTIKISENPEKLCLKIQFNPTTQCAEVVKKCDGSVTKERSIKELLGADHVEVTGSPCNNFTTDVPGNTYYYCSGGYCYAY